MKQTKSPRRIAWVGSLTTPMVVWRRQVVAGSVSPRGWADIWLDYFPTCKFIGGDQAAFSRGQHPLFAFDDKSDKSANPAFLAEDTVEFFR